MLNVEIFFILLGSYLFGSIHPILIISKYFGKINLNEKGTKNIGLGNFVKYMGKKWGLVLLPYEFGIKGCLPIIIGQELKLENQLIINISIMVIVGHCWSIFNNFKGGRGILAGSGILLIISPIIFFISLLFIILGKYLIRLNDSALLVLLAIILLPIWGMFFGSTENIYHFSVLFSLVILIKRLLSNSFQNLKSKSNIKNIMFYRLIYDRDIKNRNKWKNQH